MTPDLEVALDAELSGRHDVAATLRAQHFLATGLAWCTLCSTEYDPEWCMCGREMDSHWSENHSPVEMCACSLRPVDV